jgi:FkbM family methyltransferase
MKRLIKQITPRLVRGFVARLERFYASGSVDSFPSQEGAFYTLKKLGWNPKSCIDVGAYHGEWAKMFLSIFPNSKILMIEAQEGKRGILQKAAIESRNRLVYEMALLGANDGQEVSFIEMETGSSVYEESSSVKRAKTVKKLISLDSLVKKHPDFASTIALKIDTQGYELEVLKGCPNLLKLLDVVLLEVSLVNTNKGAPLFAEVVSFMTSNGFKLFDFCSQIRRKDGVLWQTDLLFIQVNSNIEIPTELTGKNW